MSACGRRRSTPSPAMAASPVSRAPPRRLGSPRSPCRSSRAPRPSTGSSPWKPGASSSCILVPGGLCALIWNTAFIEGSAFAIGYEKLKVEFGTDHNQIRHAGTSSGRVASTLFYGAGNWKRHTFENHQVLDLAGLRGRLLSLVLLPQRKGVPSTQPMMAGAGPAFCPDAEGRPCFENGLRNGAIPGRTGPDFSPVFGPGAAAKNWRKGAMHWRLRISLIIYLMLI